MLLGELEALLLFLNLGFAHHVGEVQERTATFELVLEAFLFLFIGGEVLLGALAILAGNRVGKEVIGKYGDSCTVEGQISFPRADIIEAFLEENALPPCEDGAVVISRSIHRQKTARILINGALTTLSVLAKMGRLWVDFHGANEPQKLFSEKNQLSMLD